MTLSTTRREEERGEREREKKREERERVHHRTVHHRRRIRRVIVDAYTVVVGFLEIFYSIIIISIIVDHFHVEVDTTSKYVLPLAHYAIYAKDYSCTCDNHTFFLS
jgi:hypothetical protein